MKTTNELLISNIERLMALRDWKVPQLAEATGLSASGLYGVLEGRRFPGPDNIDRIAKAFGVSVSELFLAPGELLGSGIPRDLLSVIAGADEFEMAPFLQALEDVRKSRGKAPRRTTRPL